MAQDKGAIALPSQIYHVGFVVEDIVKSTDFLYSMWGIGPWDIMDYTPTKAELMMGEPYKIKVSAAWLGPTQLEFLQPAEGKSIYSEFISTKGEGIHHLAFSVPNWDEMVAKLKGNGGEMIAGGVGFERRWGYFHLSPGGLIVEFEEHLDVKPLFSLPENTKVTLPPLEHVCVVVEDIEKTSKFLSSIWGLGPWEIMDYVPTREEITVGPFPMSLKWTLARLGPIVLELIQPVTGRTVWAEFLEANGEGLHHLAFSMPNYDEMVAGVQKHGGKMVFANVLHGKRSCYLETSPGGLIVEFADQGIHTDYYKKLP
jgi:catechol 2,3-dioxygenase-like lactoylglutathione lyase family enzyme